MQSFCDIILVNEEETCIKQSKEEGHELHGFHGENVV